MAEDRLVRLAEVAAEEETVVVPGAAGDVQHHLRAAEDVPRVEERERDALEYLARLVQVERLEERDQRVDVLLRVERLEQVLALRAALLVHVLEVAHLQEAAVAQHHVDEVDRGRARIDLAAEPAPHELRQVARMVDVGVREDHRVDGRGVHRHVPVPLERLFAVPLVEPAV